MDSVSAAGPNPTSLSNLQYQGELARLAYLGISEEQSADIAITTAEGDTVSISSDVGSRADLLTYRHLAFSGEGYDSEHLQLVDLQAEQSLSITVKGDLNEQETADIQALLKDLGSRLKAFLSGDAETAGAEPATYASLQSYTADLEDHREMTYVEAGQAQVTASGTAGQTAETPPAETPPTAAVDNQAQQLADRTQEYRPTRRMLKQLKKLLKALVHEMHAAGGIDGRQAGHGQAIVNRMFDRLGSQGRDTFAVAAVQASAQQETVSLHYEMNAAPQVEPQVEQTA